MTGTGGTSVVMDEEADVHIAQVRKKVGAELSITTERSLGHRLEPG